MKKYYHDKARYFTRNTLTGYFMVAIALFSAVQLIIAPAFNLYIFTLIIAAYGAINQFILRVNPEEVSIDDNQLILTSMGKSDVYNIEDITRFHMKELSISGTMFLRIETKNGAKRRYWVGLYFIEHHLDMMAEFYYLERKFHPQHLKFRGRDQLGIARPGAGPASVGYVPPAEDNQEQPPTQPTQIEETAATETQTVE